MTISIRPARAEEAPVLSQIAFEAKRFWGYPPAWMDAWTDQLTLTESDVAAWIVRVADVEGAVAGFAALEPTSRTAMELEHLWVRPGWMGKGIGRTLVRDCQRQAAARGVSEIWIDSDPNAEAFYEHLGARRQGVTRSAVAGHPRELPRMRLPVQVEQWLHRPGPSHE